MKTKLFFLCWLIFNCSICTGKKLTQNLCDKLKLLETRGGANGTSGVTKLCASYPINTDLELRVNRLLQISDNEEIKAILGDITKNDNAYTVSKFMGQFDSNAIDAWQLLYLYGQPERRINNPLLQKTKVLQDDNAFVSQIGGVNGLAEIIAKNSRAPYKGCTNCSATYLVVRSVQRTLRT